MNQQSGRSLIEILGVLTISAVMIAAAGGMYHAIDQRQKRVVALETMKDIANQTKTLMEYSGSYEKVSIEYLINAGVLKNSKAPIGKTWEIKPTNKGFAIKLFKLTFEECVFFTTKNIEWASYVIINDNTITGNIDDDEDVAHYCLEGDDNSFSFVIE